VLNSGSSALADISEANTGKGVILEASRTVVASGSLLTKLLIIAQKEEAYASADNQDQQCERRKDHLWRELFLVRLCWF